MTLASARERWHRSGTRASLSQAKLSSADGPGFPNGHFGEAHHELAGAESVTLLSTSPAAVDLTGWTLADGTTMVLSWVDGGCAMAPNRELWQATAAELAGRIRRRELSAVEVMDAAIGRIESDNERLNAFVHLDLDQARDRARQADQAVASGAELGPLHGVPTAMKDLFDFKPGWPTTFGGVRALKDFVPDFYCAWAERMERAGAIIVGKTNNPVMGFRGTCDNPVFGPSRNPFDTSRNTGGSSGGSAAAVAAGLVPVAEGTDDLKSMGKRIGSAGRQITKASEQLGKLSEGRGAGRQDRAAGRRQVVLTRLTGRQPPRHSDQPEGA